MGNLYEPASGGVPSFCPAVPEQRMLLPYRNTVLHSIYRLHEAARIPVALILHTLPPVTAFLSILLHDMVIFPLTIVLLFSACHTPSLHESVYYKCHSVFIIGGGNIICDLFYLRLCVCHCHTKPGKCNHRLVIKAISTADHLLLLFSQIF